MLRWVHRIVVPLLQNANKIPAHLNKPMGGSKTTGVGTRPFPAVGAHDVANVITGGGARGGKCGGGVRNSGKGVIPLTVPNALCDLDNCVGVLQ